MTEENAVIEASKRRLQARRRLEEQVQLEHRIRRELHELTLRRQDLTDRLRAAHAHRGAVIVATRNDLELNKIAEVLEISRDTARKAMNDEMRRQGMGSWE